MEYLRMRSASDLYNDPYTLTKAVPRENWIPDKSVKFCKVCFRKFSLLIRRHHCRGCGHVFCNSCAPKIGSYSGAKTRMCGDCCDQRVAEIQGNLRQLKEKEAKFLNRSSTTLHIIDLKKSKDIDSSPSSQTNSPLDYFSKSSSPVSSNYSFTPSKKEEELDPQSKHKLRQQQLRIQSVLQEDEIKEKEKRDSQASPMRKTTLWALPSERIHIVDLGYDLGKAARVDVNVIAQVKWMLDMEARKCLDCAFRFDSVIRRHHCRVCGAIFCASCVPEVGIYHGVPVRICADCYHHAKETKRIADQEQQARKALVTEALKKRKDEILGEKSVML